MIRVKWKRHQQLTSPLTLLFNQSKGSKHILSPLISSLPPSFHSKDLFDSPIVLVTLRKRRCPSNNDSHAQRLPLSPGCLQVEVLFASNLRKDIWLLFFQRIPWRCRCLRNSWTWISVFMAFQATVSSSSNSKPSRLRRIERFVSRDEKCS